MQAFDSFRFVEKDSRGERDGKKERFTCPFFFPSLILANILRLSTSSLGSSRKKTEKKERKKKEREREGEKTKGWKIGQLQARQTARK